MDDSSLVLLHPLLSLQPKSSQKTKTTCTTEPSDRRDRFDSAMDCGPSPPMMPEPTPNQIEINIDLDAIKPPLECSSCCESPVEIAAAAAAAKPALV